MNSDPLLTTPCLLQCLYSPKSQVTWRKRSSLWFKTNWGQTFGCAWHPQGSTAENLCPLLLPPPVLLPDSHWPPSFTAWASREFPPGFQASHWRCRPMSSLNPALGTTFTPLEYLPLSYLQVSPPCHLARCCACSSSPHRQPSLLVPLRNIHHGGWWIPTHNPSFSHQARSSVKCSFIHKNTYLVSSC